MPALDPPDKARAMVRRFLSLAGIDDPELTAEAESLLEPRIVEISAEGLRESDLAVMGQAYIRATGRVVAAETEAISRLRAGADVPGGDRQLVAVADRLVPLGRDVFDALHGLLLRRAVAGGPGRIDRSRRSLQAIAVAHVDVVASTAMLESATLGDTQRMIDGLFSAAQASIRGRQVEVTKYVGDGVFLVGADPESVAAAALDCVHRLAADAGLGARAGLGFGRVVHRAGDVFGLPVNVAERLTKRAAPGTLLAAATGTETVPASMRRHPRLVDVRGLAEPLEAYELLAPA